MNDPTKALADAAQVSQPPSDAEIDEWRDYVVRVAGLDLANEYHRHILDWGRILMRRARPDARLLQAAKAVTEDAEQYSRVSGLVVRRELIHDLRAEVARVEGK